ncbi:HigA family addiction module antidote protein [Halomonas alkaliantarctica]|nr:HigA family addiction module antidote protein [Halomonas alkaliantarctica]
MRNTKRRPVTVGQMLVTEFLEPMNLEIGELADAMGVHRNTLSRIVHDKGTLTAPMAIKLATALGNTPEFWLNTQHAVELWDVRHSAYEKERENVRPVRSRSASPRVTG